MNNRVREEFQKPGADKRSLPFWAWNAKMDEEELRSQVRQMKEAGVGGFFIHSRVGLETDYLGEEWMSCVRAVVAEAKEQGLYAWLYDEDRWPSGTAGGRVTSCGDAYRCKGLTLEVCATSDYEEICKREAVGRERANGAKKPDTQIGLLALYRAVLGKEAVAYQRLSFAEKHISFAEDEVLLVVRLEVSAPSEWFNNEAPPDNLNPDCVRKFIEETHEKYREAVGEEFGRTIPGIFTDEPSLNDRNAYFGEKKSWIPWTYGFGAYFEGITGYDFWEVLPQFYFDGDNSGKLRHDYWRCVTQRYSESYFQVIGQWCEENHLLFTGHFLQENKMGICTRVNGAVMPHYKHQHVPGIDMLGEQTGEYITVKQCTSVANQLGKKQVLSETYGCTGWEFTFEGQKWIGDWQYVLGVNRRCQHLMLYSIRGCRKRDYPPSFNYNTSWWKDNKIVDDYFARLAVVLEQGEAVRDILLLHPASTAWLRLGVNPYGNPRRREERDTPGINAYGDDYNALIEYLERQHLDCDLGDELLIKQYGRVESCFIIGNAAYRTVVLPPMDTLLSSTCELLLSFMEQGGLVYTLEKEPCFLDGGREGEELLYSFLSHKNRIAVGAREELPRLLKDYRTISIRDEDGQECRDVLYQLRRDGEDYYLFLVNNNRNREADVLVRLPFCGEAVRMELLSGELVSEEGCRNDEAGMRLFVHLEKTGSAAYYIKLKKKQRVVSMDTFAYRLSHRNVLPLDRCRSCKAEEQEIWQLQKELREQLGMRSIHHNGIEQRYKWINTPHPQDGRRLEMRFSFMVDTIPKEAFLAMERPEEFSISLNGQPFAWSEEGWLLDKEIRQSRLPKLRQGENELLLACDYRNDMELENIYLVGDFGVDGNRHVTGLPERLSTGSWTEQGLKHYCGSVTYLMEYELQNEAEAVCLKLPEIQAVCVKMRINGRETVLPWNFDRELSIGQWLTEKKNLIELEVVGSPRNMMGPFHLKQKPSNTNDAAFCPSGDKYAEGYLLAPYGIMGEVECISF